jgi:hypothetical protein
MTDKPEAKTSGKPIGRLPLLPAAEIHPRERMAGMARQAGISMREVETVIDKVFEALERPKPR